MASGTQRASKRYSTKFDEILHEQNFVTDMVAKVEAKTGIRRLYIAYSVIGFLALYLMVGYGSDFLCNFIGFCYPAFESIKAIEYSRKDNRIRWLMYWIVYNVFARLEFFSDIILFWIPFYWFFKCIFLLWCMMPGPHNGANVIYNNLIKGFFLKHESEIDDAINSIGQKMDEAKKTVTNAAAELVSNSQKADKEK